MSKKIIFILCFVATFASGQDSNRLHLRIESLNVPYNFKSINVFRASDFEKLTNALTKLQYLELFQDLAKDRQTGDGEHTISGLPHSKEFLLTKHQINNQYDFVTILKETETGKRIYWLAYHSKDSMFELFGDSLRFEKGKLTNHGILSDEYENDSIKYRSYSVFIEQDKIIQTKLVQHSKDLKFDSTITYIELLLHPFNDGFIGKAVGEQHYENGILIDEMWESEVEWTKQRK